MKAIGRTTGNRVFSFSPECRVGEQSRLSQSVKGTFSDNRKKSGLAWLIEDKQADHIRPLEAAGPEKSPVSPNLRVTSFLS